MSPMKIVYIALDIIFLANVSATYDGENRIFSPDEHSSNSFQGLSSSSSGANAAAASLFSDNEESIDAFQRQDSFFFPSQDSFFDAPQDSFYSLKTEKEEEEEEEEQQQEQQTNSYFTSQYDDPLATGPDYAEQHVMTPLWRQNTMQFNDGDDHGIGIATGVMPPHEITFLPPIIRIFEQIFLPNNKLLITSDATPQMFYQPRQDTAKLICNYINKKISTIERYQHDPSDMRPFGACFTYWNSKHGKHGKHDISIDMKQLGLRGKILFEYLMPNVKQQQEIKEYEISNDEFGRPHDIYFPDLIYLDLSHNYIIQTLNLQYLKHCAIETLVLSHNGIYGDIDFTGIHQSSLQSISLSYNDIKNVNWDSLSYSIYHDKIYSASGKSIPWFTAVHWTNLKYIYLAGNPRLDTKINVNNLKDSEFHLIDLQYVDNVKIIGNKHASDKNVNVVNGKRAYVVANKPNGQIIY